MKLCFFDDFKLGVLNGDQVVDVSDAVKDIPRVGPQDVLNGVITGWATYKGKLEAAAKAGKGVPVSQVKIRPPLPKPTNIVAMAVNYMEDGTRSEPAPINAFHKSPSALIDWMPFLNDGYPEDWVQTLTAVEKLDFTHIVPGHGDVLPKSHLTFFRGYLTDLIAAVKKASADGATLAEMQTKIGDQLAPKYEAGMSKYPVGRYRDRIGQNVEMVHKKVVNKA